MGFLASSLEDSQKSIVGECRGLFELDPADLLDFIDSELAERSARSARKRPSLEALPKRVGASPSRESLRGLLAAAPLATPCQEGTSLERPGRCVRTRRTTTTITRNVKSNSAEILELACEVAIDKGFANVTWTRGFSALHLAAKHGSLEHVRRLLAEADAISGLNLQDNSGKRPLDHALARKEVDLELLELLDPAQVADVGVLQPRKADLAQHPSSQFLTARRRCASQRRQPRSLSAPAQKLPTVPEEKTAPPVPCTTPAALPTLLASHGLARDACKSFPPCAQQRSKLERRA